MGHGKGKGKKANDPRWYFGAQNVGIGSGSPPPVKGGGRSRGVQLAPKPARPRPQKQVDMRAKRQIISSDEVVGTITGNSVFETNKIVFNPGNSDTFPWVSQLAALYERYRFISCEVYYKPTVSAYATNGQMGKIILSFDYDALTSDLETYRQAETMDPHRDGMPYESIYLVLDPKRLTPAEGKFVRGLFVPPGGDIKTYDAGALFVSVTGNTDTTQIGELRVRYEIEFMNPRLPDSVTQVPNSTVSSWAGTHSMTTGVLAVANFATLGGDGNGLSIINTAGVLTMHAGIYTFMCCGIMNNNASDTTLITGQWYVNNAAVTFGGSAAWSMATAATVGNHYVTVPLIMKVAEGDVVDFRVQQNGGGSLTFTGHLQVSLV
jgi:hypothetical protein